MTRFVKLTLKREYIEAFRAKFDAVNAQIAAMPGCNGVRLLQDIADPCVFFTHSEWESEAALNAYRESPLFITTWAVVKTWFSERATAWSLE